IRVDITNPDPAEGRVARRKIIRGRSNAQQSEVIEDGIGTEEADVAADLDRAKPGRADRAEELAEIDAGGPETERRPSIVGIEKADVRVVAAGIDAYIDANIHAQ